MSFLFQCFDSSSSTAIPTFLGKQPIAKANKQIKCTNKERNVLLDFKAGLRDPYQHDCISAWGTKKEDIDNCCKWLGVTCNNQTGHVVGLNLSSCGLEGEISLSLLNLIYLNHLDLSRNSFNGTIPMSIGCLTELRVLHLFSNSFTGNIPNSVGFLTKLTSFDLSQNSLNGTIPESIGYLTELIHFGLDSNSFSGNIPLDLSTFTRTSELNLSSNNFYGPITNVSSALVVLNLSKTISMEEFHFCVKLLMDLYAQNNLSGRLPASIKYLIQLSVLVLYSNNLSGELPLSMRNCTGLTFLDLGDNRFSGNIPVWIGENLGLKGLSLGSNDFLGPIPLQFCRLVNLRILDLSMNNLNGTIPSCVNNITSMVQQEFLTPQSINGYMYSFNGSFGFKDYIDQAIVQWQGIRREFVTKNLRLLRIIDISSNNLSGQIPNKLIDLQQLVALNLSKNALSGEIPHKIGQIKNILTLDLSRNHFSGGIPSSISEMTLLNYLDVSYNNLSGRIPSSTQLQSFEASRYIGNAGLCGLPLPKSCTTDEGFQVPSTIGEREGNGDEADKDELDRWFYIGGAIGFAFGFWIVCITLLVISRGRRTFFDFLDTLEDWIYVKVLVFKAKF
uniref:LRR receptor-like serine/threonine-protein kinase FLS2 n=1 Tax=Erigeron canadensis TaxID=72917 RepID=UPI001CB8B741|nr:LRR receptor-like serine/threonine-protein kinase FLS2 [Erigeron canadensis]